MTLISHLPLPTMPFQTHVNTVFHDAENGNPKVEATEKAIDKKVEKYKYTDAYIYHPHNMNKVYPQRQGENVDFVVA